MRFEGNAEAVEKNCSVCDVIDTPRQDAFALAFVIDADLQCEELGHDVVGSKRPDCVRPIKIRAEKGYA